MGLVLLLGNFDGLHLGHQHAIKTGLELSREAKSPLSLLKLIPHPMEFFHNANDDLKSHGENKRIFLLSDHLFTSGINRLGVDKIIEMDFSKLSNLSPEEFFSFVILKDIKPSHIVVGSNFRFGKNRVGDCDLLRKLCAESKIEFVSVDLLKHGDESISSSRIRSLIAQGKISFANELLGRPWSVEGKVEHGLGKGKKLGFPTANIRLDQKIILPKVGVYYGYIEVDRSVLKAAVNVGFRPALKIDNLPLEIEAHILDFDHDIYGKHVTLSFANMIREEKDFNSIEDLIEQMGKDVELTRYSLKDKTTPELLW